MAIDLSKLSDSDLDALQANDLSKVSDDGLNYLQQAAGPAPASQPEANKSLLPQDDDSDDALGAAAAGASEAMFNIPTYAAAGLDYISDSAKGKVPKSWLEYKRKRQEVNKRQEEAHPVAHALGGVAGGLAMAPLLPELGAGEAVAGLLPEATSALGKAGVAALSGAAEGAIPGAAYGLSQSEHGLDKPLELAKDVGAGAVGGAAVGGALGAATSMGKSAINAAKEASEESGYYQKLKQVFGLGRQGVNLSTDTGETIAKVMRQRDIPNEIVDKFLAADKVNGEALQATIDEATQSGLKINIDQSLGQSAERISNFVKQNPLFDDIIAGDRKSDAVLNLLQATGEKSEYTPQEAKQLRDMFLDLGDRLGKAEGEVASNMSRQASRLGSEINDALKEQIPGYRNAAERFAEFRSLVPESVLQPGVPLDKRSKFLGDLKNRKTDLLTATRRMTEGAKMPGDSAATATSLEELRQGLDTLRMTNPKAYEAMGGDSAFKNIEDKAFLSAGIRQAEGTDPSQTIKRSLLGELVGTGHGMGLTIANKAGVYSKMAGQSAPVQQATKLFSAGNDALMGLASKMQASPATKMLGNALETALTNKTDTAKNAVLFRMLQDPTYRAMLRDEGYDQEFK